MAMACKSNFFSTGANEVCSSCPSGSHSKPGQAACVSTPPGHYWNGTRDVKCPAGRFSASGATNLTHCKTCGEGSYSEVGAIYCSTVGAGKKVVKVGELRVGASYCDAMTSSIGASDICAPCDGGERFYSSWSLLGRRE